LGEFSVLVWKIAADISGFRQFAYCLSDVRQKNADSGSILVKG